MSLLLELLQQLLDYLGIPVEQLVPIWERYMNRQNFFQALQTYLPLLFPGINVQVLERLDIKEYGWTRSTIRVIGTLLPLAPCPRPLIQHITGPHLVEEKNSDVCGLGIPSLGDVHCLTEDNVFSYTTFRHDLTGNNFGEVKFLALSNKKNPSWKPIMLNSQTPDTRIVPSSDNAVQKIAVLEDELAQLRAQIAAIIAMQKTKSVQPSSIFESPSAVLPHPPLTSTPITGQHGVAPPLPPPPPPLPVLSTKVNSEKSALDLIKQRRAAHKPKTREKETVNQDNKVPSMMDILKNMNSVKLRSVERSPGGTPVSRKNKKRHSINDPATIIANALKQKFAHRTTNESFDKENISYEESSFSSPETPRVQIFYRCA
ncbi:hypothetical protein GDO86_009670 [Hymenochirus boettgeri]|uniref:Mitochondrial fission regulator n=1 Tax=Hymenochirus boettgeri TaxID=247094 RepID=A0A8T2JJW3_9PIPI|nr:hypothetical protein GDO86_009670 [Hymenochirus boettgeri]